MTVYQSQIMANTEEAAQQFIQTVDSEDVSVEEWKYNVGTPEHKQEFYSFELTHFSPKRLQHLAEQMELCRSMPTIRLRLTKKTISWCS